MKKEMVCINCPLGCRLTVELEQSAVTEITGNRCKRGAEYARQEAVLPMRILIGNMKAKNCIRPFSVRTSAPIPKSMLLDCAAELRRCHPSLPIHMGDIVIRNIQNTGVDVIATQNFDNY